MFKINKIIIGSLLFISICSIVPQAHAGCDPTIANGEIKDQNAQKKNDAAQSISKNPAVDPTSSFLSCSNFMPSLNVNFSLPSITEMYKKLLQEAKDKACDTIRQQISNQISKAQSNLSLSTANISGFSELGISDISAGDYGISTGLGDSSGVSVNGSSLSSGISSATSNYK